MSIFNQELLAWKHHRGGTTSPLGHFKALRCNQSTSSHSRGKSRPLEDMVEIPAPWSPYYLMIQHVWTLRWSRCTFRSWSDGLAHGEKRGRVESPCVDFMVQRPSMFLDVSKQESLFRGLGLIKQTAKLLINYILIANYMKWWLFLRPEPHDTNIYKYIQLIRINCGRRYVRNCS